MDPTDLGRRGEEEAARFLEREGWRVVGRNVRVGRCEVDLIVTRGDVLAFVEVKSRRGVEFGDPLAAISYKKQQCVSRAAAGWLRDRKGGAGMEIRFDAVGVVWPRDGPPRVFHVPDAWRMG